MASAPSASALSAVLRCRGTIWKRNPQSKRPAARVYGSLGTGSSSVPAQADLLPFLRRGEQKSLGRRRVSLAFMSHQERVKSAGDELAKLRHSRVAQSWGSAHPAVHDELIRQSARGLFSFLPGWTDQFGGVVRTVTYRVHSSIFWEVAVAQKLGGLSPGALKLSLTPHGSGGNSAPCLATSSWKTLKKACWSLTALVSEVIYSSLALLFCSSISKPAQLDQKQLEESDQQVEGREYQFRDLTLTEDNCSTGNKTSKGQT